MRKSRTQCSFWASSMSCLDSGRVVASPCLFWKLQNLSLWKVSEEVIMPFCVAGVALPVLQNVSVKDRSVWQAQYIAILASFFRDDFHFRDRCSSSDVSIFISRGRRSTYRRVVLRVFLRIGMSGLCRVATTRKSSGRRGTSCEGQFASPGQYLVQNHCVWNLILQGRHSIGTLHFTFHTIRFTLYTWHFTLATFHSTFYTLHFQLYTSHFKFTFRTPHSTLYTPHSTLYTPHSALYTLHFTLRTLHCRLCTPVCTLHFALRTWETLLFTLYTPHSALYTSLYTVLGRCCNKCRWQGLVPNRGVPMGKGPHGQHLWLWLTDVFCDFFCTSHRHTMLTCHIFVGLRTILPKMKVVANVYFSWI